MKLFRMMMPFAAALALTVAPGALAAGNKARTVKVEITEDGTQPATVEAKAGQPMKLVLTRKTDATCMKDVVMKEFGVDEKLPLDQPVAVTVTPEKPGTYVAKCGMGMDIVTLHVK